MNEKYMIIPLETYNAVKNITYSDLINNLDNKLNVFYFEMI